MKVDIKLIHWTQRISLIIFLLFSSLIYAQDEADLFADYKKAIVKSDSLLKIGKISNINKTEVLKVAAALDQKHPDEYLKKSLEYAKLGKYNESSFFYFLGKMRLVDFNRNGEFGHWDFGENGMLLNEMLYIYLSKDVSNYENVLILVTDYYDNNDYAYLKKSNYYDFLDFQL